MDRPGLFITDTELMAFKWASKARDIMHAYDPGQPVVLRFDNRNVRWGMKRDDLGLGLGNWVIRDVIPPEALEVKMGQRWVPLKEYVRGTPKQHQLTIVFLYHKRTQMR